ncbi:hypothetical protein IFM89_004547 [Coptis chinensis]|uniref:Phytocyanin domain-containing protein n=1 Tax=Coptis chinensis TaxID=261450 RepID=A0A835H6I4_9MAGN|nr:hypothetical protein IFM89_004547 [Coptis chinensis]
MGGERRSIIVPILWMMVLALMVVTRTQGKRINLGGVKEQGWKPDYNYTEWSMKQRFYVNDWLYFGYDRKFYNVLQVNKTAYENCISEDPVFNVTGGAGRDVFELKKPVTYYFLSGGGYCYHGMKVAVHAENHPPPPSEQPSPPAKNGSQSNFGTYNIMLLLGLAVITTWLFKSLY